MSNMTSFNEVASALNDIETTSHKLRMQLSELENRAALGFNAVEVKGGAQLASMLNSKRHERKIDLEMLSLQTDVSVATLKRLFKDADSVKFSTVLNVARELGVKLCAAM